MRSVASTPLRFIGMVVAINAALITAILSLVAIISSKYLASVAHRFDSLLHTRRFSSTIHHVDRAGILGLLITAAVIAGVVLCLRAPRIAALTFLGSAIVGVIITPFVVATPTLFLLNASAIVFFGRKETPIKLTKSTGPAVEPPAFEPRAVGSPAVGSPALESPTVESPPDAPTEAT